MNENLIDEELDAAVKDILKSYLKFKIHTYAHDQPINPDVIAVTLDNDQTFSANLTSYASLRRQELDAKEQDRLSKSNLTTQRMLGIFAGLSIIIQILIGLHIL